MTQGARGDEALAEIDDLRASLVLRISEPVEIPEPDGVLDVESRRGDEARIYKHILQSSLLHREHYAHANRVKHLYLLDAFLRSAADQNPMGLYSAARSMFELSAFMHEVRVRLVGTVQGVNDKTWQPLGEKFFALLVRARYATTNPGFRKLLLDAGMPAGRLKPFNITECVRGLSEASERGDSVERYSLLCDFVHHNLSSGTTSTSGIRLGTTAQIGAGSLMTPGKSTITRYEYPVVGKFSVELGRVAPGFLRDATDCIRWGNETPQAPFPAEMNERMTGSDLGIPRVLGARQDW